MLTTDRGAKAIKYPEHLTNYLVKTDHRSSSFLEERTQGDKLFIEQIFLFHLQ